MATNPESQYGTQRPDYGYGSAAPSTVPITLPDNGSWASGVGAAVALQPAWQAIGRTYDELTAPEDEDFSAYRGDYLKGYESYSSEFIGTRSRYEGDRIKARIDRNEGYRKQVDNTLGFWGMMAAEVANPVNYLPLPGLMGGGVIKGLLKGTASGLALGAGEELLRLGVDPTATTEEAVDNTIYGGLFTGLLGGVVGRIGAKDMQQFTRGYADYQNNIDRALDITRNPALEPEPVTHSGAEFVARPTGASETGVKKAFGLEKQTLATWWGRLQAVPVRAVNDFADAVLGDFGTMSAKNAQGIATQQSALLASDRWKGWASGFAEDLNNIYARYLGDGTAGPAVFGLNLRTTGSRLAETLGRTGRPDGKMSFGEFKDAIFRAHKTDRIETDNPFVREGVDRAREFYDRAMIDGVKTGAIASAEGGRRLMQRRVSMVRDRMRRFEELEALPNPTHNNLMEMAYIGRLQERHIRELSRHLDRQLADDPDIGNILDELEERFHRQETADRDLRESLIASGARQRNAAQELRDAIERSIEERIAKDRAVLAELNRKYETTGLTDRQKAYRDDLETRVRNYDEEGVRGTERQQTVMEDIDAKLDAATAPEGWGTVEGGAEGQLEMTDLSPEHLAARTADELLNRIAETSTNDYHRALGARLALLTEGVPIRIYGNEVHPDTLIPGTSKPLREVSGVVVHSRDGQATLILNNADYARGGTEETALHEGIHAAAAIRVGQLRKIPLNNAAAAHGFDADARALFNLAGKTKKAFEDALEKGELQLSADTIHQAKIGFDNIDEFLTYSLTNKEFAQWLDTVAMPGYRDVTIWQHMINVLRDLIGLDAKYTGDFKIALQKGTAATQTAEVANRILTRLEATPAVPQKPVFGRRTGPLLTDEVGRPLNRQQRAKRDREQEARRQEAQRAYDEGDDVYGDEWRDDSWEDDSHLEDDPNHPAYWHDDTEITPEERDALAAGFEADFAERTQRAEGPPTEAQARAFLSDRQLRLLDDLEERLTKENDYAGPENEKFYLPRLWDLDKVVADENGSQRLRGILTDWFVANPLPGASINPEAIERRVRDALKSILKEAQTGDIQVTPTGFKSVTSARRINIPNELVMDFIDTDIENVTRNYGTRFGAGTEMARMFGTVDAEDAIDDVLLQSIREMQVSDVESGLKQIDGLKGDLEWARDKMTGAVYSNDPAMMNRRRLVGGVKGWATVTTLGKVALSSIPELGRAGMVLGFRRTFSHALDILNQPHELSRYLREITNEGMDTVTTGGVDRFVEHGGPTGAATGLVSKAADKQAKFAHGPFMLATALPMLTDLTKRMNLSYINHFLMEDIHKVAAGEATVKEVQRLASYGLSAEDAVKITTMPIQRKGKFFLPNTGDWSDEMLAIRYMGAVNGLSKRIVPTAGLADVPEIVKGFVAKREYPLITMPFQFMNYGFAAANKVLLSSLQGRDQSAMYGTVLMIGLGYLTAKAKMDDQAWQNTPAEERIVLAVDQSGLTAIYSNGASMVEAATMGRVGVRPMLGMDPFMRDQSAYGAATQLGGVATSKIGQVAGLFIGDEPEAKEISSVVRRSIPMNNLFYWDSLWKDVEKSMLGWGEEDTPPPPPPTV